MHRVYTYGIIGVLVKPQIAGCKMQTVIAMDRLLTHQYNPDWSCLDQSVYVGRFEVNQHLVDAADEEDDCTIIKGVARPVELAPGATPEDCMAAIRDTMAQGCSCARDCCGHLTGGVREIRQRADGAFEYTIVYRPNY